jgi:hypothetical protein
MRSPTHRSDHDRSSPPYNASSLVLDDREAAAHAFARCEQAKGDELLEELQSHPPAGEREEVWRGFQAAGRRLARAEADRIVALADSSHTSLHDDAVLQAADKRQSARRALKGSSTDTHCSLTSLASSLPDEDTVFVHLYHDEGRLRVNTG